MLKKDAVWFISGCSRGLGRAMAEQVLKAGYRVAATARNEADLSDLVRDHGEKVFSLSLDVTDAKAIGETVGKAEMRFGGVDVLVNNAGYGYFGAIEEGEDAEIRALMETDVFGPLNLIKAVLPGMRARKAGSIVNISSIGGFVTSPSVGYYHMAKFALEGLSEALAKEVSPFGIRVTIVEPGAFRTDFRKAESNKQSKVRIADYADTAGKARDNIFAAHGKQKGDPVLGARAIIKAVEADKPPVRLIIGTDAVEQASKKIAEMQDEMKAWDTLSRSTDLKGVD